jgi:hypothetical protein
VSDGEKRDFFDKMDSRQKHGWLEQDNLIYAGLIGISVVLAQPQLTATSPRRSPSSRSRSPCRCWASS